MKRVVLLILCFWAILVGGLAQKLTVEKMTASPMDLSASQYRRMDLAGEACALVKVQLTAKEVGFEGNVIQPVEYKGGEYWVYMTKGSRELRIKHLAASPAFLPCHINFADYGISGVEPLTTYELTILTGEKMQKLIIDYTPTNAIVVVDSKPYQSNGHLELMLPVGTHDYQIVAMGYDTVEGSVKLNTSSPSTIKLTATQQQTTNQTVKTVQPSIPVAQKTEIKPAEDPEIKGKTAAQIRSLGYDYQNGTSGKAKDYAKAMKYARIAADRGNTDAMVDVGNMYRLGYGVEKNLAESVKWFRKAAEQGNAVAQFNLGYSYVSGNGIEKNPTEALMWYRKAADQGIAKAQTILGLYYHQKGETAQAKEWYELAAAQGEEEAKKRLSELEKLSPVKSQTPDPQPSSATSSASEKSIETITVGSVSFNMIRVEGGTFQMGATSEQGGDAYDNEKPAHPVTLSSFSIGETEVTQELWKAVMDSNPSKYKGKKHPVENVSWNDCQEFIRKLNAKTGRQFRLPTEAEWEYAARGGRKCQGYKYSGSNTIDDVAWYSNTTQYKGTRDVKTKKANELGLYDMSGNVWEWCQDRYGNNSRVIRGGGWDCSARGCRVPSRGDRLPDNVMISLGLRLAQ